MLEELKKQVYEANMELPRRSLITHTCKQCQRMHLREKGYFVKPSGVIYKLTPDDKWLWT